MAAEPTEAMEEMLLAEVIAILDASSVEDPETEPAAVADELPSDDEEFAVAQGGRS